MELLHGISYICCGYTHLGFEPFRSESGLCLVERLPCGFPPMLPQSIDRYRQIFNTGCGLNVRERTAPIYRKHFCAKMVKPLPERTVDFHSKQGRDYSQSYSLSFIVTIVMII